MTDGRRILVLAPHPDDEVVGCAIAARRAAADGAKLFVLYLTTGLPERRLLWPWARASHAARVARRRDEALAAAVLLRIEPVGFGAWAARTLRNHLPDAAALIEATMRRHRIDRIWAPAYEGGHQDHDAVNLLAAGLARRVLVTEFAEYHNAAGRTASQAFIAPNGTERVLTLTPEEQALKRRALALYRSERGNLAHTGCAAEALRPLAVYDYAKPPHEGALFWTRFQWVPFRHPRIDFTAPAQVYAALAAHARAQSADDSEHCGALRDTA
jgi:LmbE family N-acetylglucosaminyl deacetylase